MYHQAFFGRFATLAARAMGHPLAFVLAVLIIVGWALTGPSFGLSDTWQLLINTGTTIVTFLMVFLIQNTHVKALGEAKSTMLVQAYSFTSAPIAKAVLDAHKRGIQGQVILDKSGRGARPCRNASEACQSW